MTTISTLDPIAVAAVNAIHAGRVEELRQHLAASADLATARLGDDDPDGTSRSLLHVVTDWPGHFPNVSEIIKTLVSAGAEVNARFRGPHEETPLHWAASSDDVDAINALLDSGADIDADGGVIAARTLVARGALAGIFDLAALGMTGEVLAVIENSDGHTTSSSGSTARGHALAISSATTRPDRTPCALTGCWPNHWAHRPGQDALTAARAICSRSAKASGDAHARLPHTLLRSSLLRPGVCGVTVDVCSVSSNGRSRHEQQVRGFSAGSGHRARAHATRLGTG